MYTSLSYADGRLYFMGGIPGEDDGVLYRMEPDRGGKAQAVSGDVEDNFCIMDGKLYYQQLLNYHAETTRMGTTYIGEYGVFYVKNLSMGENAQLMQNYFIVHDAYQFLDLECAVYGKLIFGKKQAPI